MKQLKTKQITSCPFCHNKIVNLYNDLSDRLETVHSKYSVDSCTSCGLAFTNPLPTSNLDVLYPKNYLLPQTSAATNLFTKYRNDQYRFDFDLFCHATNLQRSQITSLLDVGCGSGERIRYAKSLGISSVIGIDKYDNTLNEQTKNIVNSSLMDYVPKKKFQVVSLFHVLEHLDNPKQYLKHIRDNYMEKDGYLIIQVPNFDSFERKVFKERWFSFDVPRHLWHFSDQSLTYLLKESGFKILKSYKKNAFLHPVTIAPSLYKNADPQRIWQIESRWKMIYYFSWMILTFLTVPWSLLQSLLESGSMLTMIVKKSYPSC